MVFTNAPMMTALSGNCIDLPSIGLIPEVTLIAKAEIEQVNHTELVTALDILIGAQRSNTKYKALNLQTDITIEQKKVLERVFDILLFRNISNRISKKNAVFSRT